MSDYIVRATAGNGSIRAFAATTRDLVQHAREIHHTSPVASAALGRMLTAAAMMGSMLKGEKDIVTLQIRGEGPLQGLVVTSDSHARVKGYVFNPNVEIPDLYPGKLNVGGAVFVQTHCSVKGAFSICTGTITKSVSQRPSRSTTMRRILTRQQWPSCRRGSRHASRKAIPKQRPTRRNTARSSRNENGGGCRETTASPISGNGSWAVPKLSESSHTETFSL